MIHRLKAFAVHLALSALVLAILFAVIFLLWYPHPYFQVQGTMGIIAVLVGVDLVLGPSLTFLVFVPGKRGLKFDLAVIVLVQLIALVYGTHAIHSERPYFMVFGPDRFNVLAARDIDFEAIGDARFLAKPWRGPIYAVAKMPDEPGAYQRLLEETLFEGKPDIEQRPEYWAPYQENLDTVLASARSLEFLHRRRPTAAAAIERVAERAGRPMSALFFQPVIGKQSDFALVLDPADGAILAAIPTDPWFD